LALSVTPSPPPIVIAPALPPRKALICNAFLTKRAMGAKKIPTLRFSCRLDLDPPSRGETIADLSAVIRFIGLSKASPPSPHRPQSLIYMGFW
jgi:hypothetical protein